MDEGLNLWRAFLGVYQKQTPENKERINWTTFKLAHEGITITNA